MDKNAQIRFIATLLLLIPLGVWSQQTITDIDGNTYSTIVVGEQEWMASNLRVGRYRNGDPILSDPDHSVWQQTTEGIWAWYDNDETTNAMYGKLYNWYATQDARGLCPVGWRVPTDQDWHQLLSFVDPNAWGNNNTLGTRLKTRRQVDSPLGAPWNTNEHPRWDKHGNRFGTDNYGFSALPGGGKTMGAAFIHKGQQAYFWTRSQWSESHAWVYTILFSHRGMSRSAYQKSMGMSVRCIKGNDPQVFTLSLSASPSQAGKVTGSGQAEEGASLSITASTNPGYQFLYWTQGGEIISTKPDFIYTMPPADTALVAAYEKLESQNNTEFWLAIPKVTQGHDWGRKKFLFQVANQEYPNQIELSMPANPAFAPIVRNIDANQAENIDVTNLIEQIWTEHPSQIYNRGIKITSIRPITAYFEVGTPNNPEIFSLKGRNALGTDFFVPFQDHFNNGVYNPRPYSAIYLVATQDQTTITVTPTRDVFPGRPAGVSFDTILNMGQTLAIAPDNFQGVGMQAANHLGGTRIQSNKPIAISTSDDSVAANPYGGCRDLVGDQIIPTSLLGKEYIAMKGRLGAGVANTMPEFFFITATKPNTQIRIDGDLKSTLQPGQQYRWQFTQQNHYIQTSEPAYVYHLAGFGCEMAGAVLPPLDKCTGSQRIAFTRSRGESFFLNILVKAGAEDGFIFNGNGPDTFIKASDFVAIPGNDKWLAAEFTLNQTDVPIGVASLIENVKDVFHLGVINGGPSSGAMYGYFSDFNTCATQK